MSSTTNDICPKCKESLQGPRIGETDNYYSLTITVEIRGVYDGGLFHRCPMCGHCWHRWSDPDMRAKAQPFIDQWNEGE